ncbi:MAG: GNAT family N-acetyltransferase [Acidobacteria bacterium]|nr:GNAT family N-acetyltransferase [Acidobacteriota bacterium]
MITLRAIESGDAELIATMHTTSWRTAYRGILSDNYLDGGIDEERRGEWQRRLSAPHEESLGFIALLDGEPVGFVYGFQNEHDCWGALIDNLHVLPGWKGRGIGRQLMARFAEELLARGDTNGVFLWVYEQNTAARRFYEIVGGTRSEETDYPLPGGGEARIYRITWSSPQALIESASEKSSELPG